MVTRRKFLEAAVTSCVVSSLGRTLAAASMKFGYAAITWGAEITKAIATT